MTTTEIFLPEFDAEIEKTRKMLARVRFGDLPWKPHPDSMTLARLATHIAEIPQWANRVLEHDSFDYPNAARTGHEAASSKELLEILETNATAARAAIASADDARWQGDWTFSLGGRKVFTRPRLAVVREMMLHHLIHHRGQLSVYLRLNNIPVPGMFGPSADDKRRPEPQA